MLFRTVYGPELEAIFTAIQLAHKRQSPLDRATIIENFVPKTNGVLSATQNVEDALSFLISAHLISETPIGMSAIEEKLPFRLLVLRNLRRLSIGQLEPLHHQDPFYLRLYNSLFVLPDELYIADLHGAANQQPEVKVTGGLGREKIQAWKRVMAFLGLGYRAFDGFFAVVNPSVAQNILDTWEKQYSTLDTFFETHWSKFLPFRTQTGDAAKSIQQPLLYLAKHNRLTLTTLQDSAAKAYFLPQRLRAIRSGAHNA